MAITCIEEKLCDFSTAFPLFSIRERFVHVYIAATLQVFSVNNVGITIFPIVRKYLYLSQQCHYICPNKKVNIFYLVQCCVLFIVIGIFLTMISPICMLSKIPDCP